MSSLSLNSLTTASIASSKQFHPKFCHPCHPGAEIILSSKEGTLFRIHSAILQSASGLLRLFLSGPKNIAAESTVAPNRDDHVSESTSDVTEVITLPFPDAPLERVLLMISAQAVPPWYSFAELEAAIEVMEYLDAPGPLSLLHDWCLAPVFLSEPIRVYGLGAKYGWEEVMQYAAKLTLTMNLFPSPPSPNVPTNLGAPTTPQPPSLIPKTRLFTFQEIEDQLSQLPGNALYRLLKLHRRRRDEFRAFILSTSNFPGGESLDEWQCECGKENTDDTAWRLFSSRLIWEMDQNPSGESILTELEGWRESDRMWKSECGGRGCYMKQCERFETVRKLRRCIGNLPVTL